MRNRIFTASYERGLELIAAGCPLDYPGSLARHSAAQRKTFRAQQVEGYAESRIYALGAMQTGYLICLRLVTDCPGGTIISDWGVVPPWENHIVIWEYGPLDIIPNGQREAYRDLLDSRLMSVLNERCLLRRGYPVEGLLCGCSAQPITEPVDRFVYSQLTLVDDRGTRVTLRVAMRVISPVAARPDTFQKRAGRRLHEFASEVDSKVGRK
ncbi:MAG TPA: hypothetical protein VKB40_06990 [Candidatus Acidoferrales bacterium]|nr:hypothetical protein [Candidatus Acidoferrales bacterium]